MRSLLIFTFVGIGAQLVDGALGMAFGVTATTLLVLSRVGAAQASAAVHLAEVGTTFASGLSHWQFKNIDWLLVPSSARRARSERSWVPPCCPRCPPRTPRR